MPTQLRHCNRNLYGNCPENCVAIQTGYSEWNPAIIRRNPAMMAPKRNLAFCQRRWNC